MFSIIPAHRSRSVARTRRFAALSMLVVFGFVMSALHAAQPAIVQHTTTKPVRTFINADGYWDDDDNWNPKGEPEDGDHAIIPDDTVCRVRTSDARADSFKVCAGGQLLIHNQLTIDNDSQVVDSSGVELVRENPNDPEVPTLVIDGDVLLSGAGSIKGTYSGAKIIIPPYRCLVNVARIEGTLRIVGTQTLSSFATNLAQGTLINAGEIIADGDGELVIESTISLSSQPIDSGLWIVDGTEYPNAALILDALAAPLSDSFVVYSGVLRVSAPIVTSGNLIHDGGTLDVEADLTLHHPEYPETKSVFTLNVSSWSVADGATLTYDDFAGTEDNPDNTQDEDPPYEVVGPASGGG